MANTNGWGDGAANNTIGWGQGANNTIGWGDIHADSWAGLTDISGLPTTDPDAQAFITAAAITDPTQQAAINTLVVDLKGYNVWTKMKALYPFIGGTATSHSFNLLNTAQYQISWNGGITHSSNGVQFGGVNGYGDTGLNAASVLSQDSTHLSFYSRTDVIANSVEMGINASARQLYLLYRYGSSAFKAMNRTQAAAGSLYTPTNGLLIANRPSSTTEKYYHKGTLVDTITVSSTGTISANVFIGGYNNLAVPTSREYSSKQSAFASIGDGLTDTEAANFYTAVQAFQTTLGRSIGTQTVSDADAQAFVTAADIQDQVEANAINNLVIGMKADGLWTKMQAVYPFVGGTNSQHSWNLKNTAQFQISWAGGITSSANGVTGNGSNSYGNTGFNPNTAFSTNDSAHLSLYIRNNSASSSYVDFGATNGVGSSTALNSAFTNSALSLIHNGNTGISATNTNTQGFYLGSRTTASSHKLLKNTAQIGSTDTTSAGTRPNFNLFLGAYNVSNSPLYYTNRNYAFASIGDGLTDTDATNLNSRVTTFQTALNRNI
jgi:hypothetical protein